MFTDPEEARSDLFLAGAAYLFGPLLLRLVAGIGGVPVLGPIFLVVAPLVTTILVPVLLIRYRREPASNYGLDRPFSTGLRTGLLCAAPIVLGWAVPTLLLSAGQGIPVLTAGDIPNGLVLFLANLTTWIGLLGLAVYATVKGRDAFRPVPRGVREGTEEIGRILGIAAVVAVGLLGLTILGEGIVTVVALPLGVGLAGLALWKTDRLPGSTTRAALLSPVVLLALRPFQIFTALFDPGQFLLGAWAAIILAGVALIVAARFEAHREPWTAVVLAVVLALAVPASLAA